MLTLSRRTHIRITKKPIKNINIPIYVIPYYSNRAHAIGCIRGDLEVDTPHKWLR